MKYYFHLSFIHAGPYGRECDEKANDALNKAVRDLAKLEKRMKESFPSFKMVHSYFWTDGSLYQFAMVDDEVDRCFKRSAYNLFKFHLLKNMKDLPQLLGVDVTVKAASTLSGKSWKDKEDATLEELFED